MTKVTYVVYDKGDIVYNKGYTMRQLMQITECIDTMPVRQIMVMELLMTGITTNKLNLPALCAHCKLYSR